MNDAKPFVIANLKANKTWEQIAAWLDAVGPKAENFVGTVIFCPSHPFLVSSSLTIKSKNYKLELGSQDISEFEQGSYTGEVAASQIADVISFSIVGHSERREYLNEEDITLAKKVQNAKNAKIEPVFCVQGSETEIPDGVTIVAYEPTFAIGTDNPDAPQNVFEVAQSLKSQGEYTILYGGSVSSGNVKSFLKKDLIDGVLVGATNSLDPEKFIGILNSATF